MRIGILQTDSVNAEFQPEIGDYPLMFRSLLALDEAVTFSDFDAQHGRYPASPDECDAYLITGSRRSVYDDEPWIHRLKGYVVELHEARKTLIGICFGHQMIAEALGGKTEPASIGWHVGINPNQVVKQEAFMMPESPTFRLIFSHKDQVTRLPPGAELLATSPLCPNAMFRIGGHMLAIQGHPEFCKGYSRTLMQMRQEILGEETFCRGMASLEQSTEEAVVARWILNFIEEPDRAG